MVNYYCDINFIFSLRTQRINLVKVYSLITVSVFLEKVRNLCRNKWDTFLQCVSFGAHFIILEYL